MGARVLVLEDDPDLREALAEVLRDEGYEVETAALGREAVELAAQSSFDLLVSDIRMQGMSGLDAIEAVQQAQPEVGSMVISGWASEAETLRAVELNVGAYLKKPFSFEQFLEAVRTTLKRRPRAARDWQDWSLELLRQVLDSQNLVAPDGTVERALWLARRWASELGYAGQDQACAARLAVMRAVAELPGFQMPLPGPEWLTGWPGLEEPLQWLGAASWTAATLAQGEAWPPLVQLQGILPPPASAEVWAAYESCHAMKGPAPALRGLLSLGQAMLEAGDAESARTAFRKALEEPGLRLQAGLQLALLEWRRGETRSAVEWARQVYQGATRLGPLSAGGLAVEAALLLWRAGLEEGRKALEEVYSWAERLGLRGYQALAILALNSGVRPAGEDRGLVSVVRALEVLSDPDYWSESQLAARWLLVEIIGLFPQMSEKSLAALVALLHLHSQALLKHVKQHGAAPQFLEALGLGQAPTAALPLLRFSSFGPFEVEVGDSPVPEGLWKTQKNKLLLAYLLRNPGQSVHEDQVLEDFWPDDVVKGKRNLYSALSYIRRALGRSQEGPDTIVRQQERLSFRWDLAHWCDHEVFLKSAQRGLELEPGEDALFHLRRAAQIYRAAYLEGCFADWALRRRDELEQILLRVLSKLCSQLCQRRHYADALEYASRFVQVAPHLQEAHLWKMRSHLGMGQPEEVIRQYAQCEKILRQEYGLEPSTEVLEVLIRARHGLPESSDLR